LAREYLSSRAFEVDKSITAPWIIGIHPSHVPQILPHFAENVAAVVLKGSISNFAAHGTGKWFSYLASGSWAYVMRPVLISRDAYKAHLLASIGHDQTKVAPNEIDPADDLPDWLWMVEFGLPALFTGNRSKLGEVLINTQVGTVTNSLDLVAGLRLPSIFAVKNAVGAFDIHKVGLASHSPFFTSRMHGNEW
jgi:hypothetical protein